MEFLCLGTTILPASVDQLDFFKDGVNQFKNDERTKAFYGFSAEQGGCIICDVNSHQELDQFINLNPITQFTDWAVFALESPDQVLNTIDKLEQQMRGLEAEAA